MHPRARAERRYVAERAKRRALARLSWLWRRRELTPRVVGLYAATRVPCSCPLCGNPRRHFGERTRQERQAQPCD